MKRTSYAIGQHTGVYLTESDFQRLNTLINRSWNSMLMVHIRDGVPMMVDPHQQLILDKVRKLAEDYGLPVDKYRYGINSAREFIAFER